MSLLAAALLGTSCESYLDKSPDMGLSEEDIFRDYNSIRGFLDQTYLWLENIHGFDTHANQRTHPGSLTDELASLYNSTPARNINSGNWLVASNNTSYELGPQGSTIIAVSYKGIRVANRVIAGLGNVPGLSETQQEELLGQACFMRAWFYFQLMKRYGGMPILDKVFVGDGDEDLPRQTYHGSHDWMMEDIERAIEMLPDRWDNNNTGRVAKVAAMSFKSMAQLYDASPLMQNDLTTIAVKPYDSDRAALAAKSASAVLKYIADNPELGYGLMDGSEYKNIFYWKAPPYTQPEYLWYNRTQVDDANLKRYIKTVYLTPPYTTGNGNDAIAYSAPTQNMVDMFEKKGEGDQYYPIDDPRAQYDPQKPFTDRDPRFTNNILYPGEKWSANQSGRAQFITLYEGGRMNTNVAGGQSTNQRQQTGYMCKKFIWEDANDFQNLYPNRIITVYIRVAQIYLDLAEASFEATGSATAKVDGCLHTAEQAVNIVRARAGITPVPEDVVADPAAFRKMLMRERSVELMFENHRWWDIRRWMTMHEIFAAPNPIKGMRATPAPAGQKGDADKWTYTYEVVNVTPEVRNYGMRNYWYPFPIDDANSLVNLKQNPGW
jgi:hypothetical protein